MERIKTLYTFIICLVFVFGSIPGIYAQEKSDKKRTKSEPNEPIFEIKNDQEQTVFAVYPGGVKIFIDDSQLKASGGGFTVGRVGTEKASGGDIFSVNTNDVRVIIDTTSSLKASGGGFTVGRVGTEKADGDEENFLTVTPDSTRIYTTETSNKGFAVGKFSSGETSVENFLNLTKDNYFIGHNSGMNNTNGIRNSFLGYQTGVENTIGSDNIFMGYQAGNQNTYGESNIFIGTRSGYLNSSETTTHPSEGDNNVFIGDLSGYNNIHGYKNVLIGSESGYNNNTNYNVCIGYRAGYSNISGIQQVFVGDKAGEDAVGRMNTFVGAASGNNVTTGENNCFLGTISGTLSHSADDNTFLGNQAGFRGSSGDTVQSYNTFVGSLAGYSASGDIGAYNTLVGYRAGYRYNNNLGHGNVFIGFNAGYNVNTNYQLYINYGSGTPLIWGDFTNDRVVIDGTSANNPNNRTFYVNGEAGGEYPWYNDSDKRLKTNISTIPGALNKVLSLRGVNFYWKDKEKKSNKLQIGFIAQEAMNIIPEVVDNTNDHFSMQYAPITAILVEAVKEQQKQIEELKEKNKSLSQQVSEIDKLKTEMSELKLLMKKVIDNKDITVENNGAE